MKLSPSVKLLVPALLCLFLQIPSFGQKAVAPPPKFAPIYNLKKSLSIDGDASDWPIPATVFLSSKDGKAQMRFAADGKNFYALVEVEDKSPLKNGADRPEEMFKGGDTVAFYFQTKKDDAQRIAVCRRNNAEEVYVYRNFIPKKDKKKPYVFSSPVGETKFEYVAPAKDAQVAFRKLDGKGYILEVCFPWRESLGIWEHRPKEFTFDAQVVFSDPGGTQNAGTAWLFSREGPALTIEDLPTEARLYPDTWGKTEYVNDVVVSAGKPELAISKPVGGAEIEVDLPRAGRLSLNITDQNGWILRELVQAKKYSAGKHKIHWDGRDRYGEALPPGDYNWKALLFDGMQTKFMGSVGNSGRPPYRTPDGLGSMGGQHGNKKSIAQDEGGIYLSNATQEGPPVMRKVVPATGKALWMRSAGGFRSVDAVAAGEKMACYINGLGKKGDYGCDLVRINPETGQDEKMGSGSARIAIEEAKGEGNNVSGMAIVDGKAWIAIPSKNIIISVDLNTGEKGKSISITKPQGLARKDGKNLLVCSGSDVFKVDTATGNKTPLVSNLEAPQAVGLDNQGNIYVSELGTSQRIKKFSADGKKLLATWGKQGGKTRQQIPYDPLAFNNITGLTVDPTGNIWLAEADSLVKRFAKLDANGKWLEDFYGPVAYNAFGPDLDDFTRVYYTIAGGCFNETKIDYEQYQKNPMDPAKAWRIVSIHDLGLAADGKTVNETMQKVAKTGYGHVIVFKADNGQRYFFRLSKHNRAASPVGAGLWIEKNKHWVPCAFISRDTKNFKSWADKNGDGLIQPEEEYQDLPIDQVSWIDRDLTLHGYKGKLSPASISDAGVPNYAGGKFKPYLNEGEEDYIGNQWTFFSREQDGAFYYISNHGPHRHLSFWDRATENRLIKVKDGKVHWVLGEHSAHPGFTQLSTNSGVAGAQDGVVLVQNVEPCNYIAFTEDGFVLGDIMVDQEGKHPSVGPYVINIESFTGLYVKDPKTKKNVLFAVSSGDDRILEVTGPGKTDRLQGKVQLVSVSPSPTSTPEIPYSTWYGNTSRDLGIDGDDTEWRPDVPEFSIMNKDQVVADCKLRRDAGNLYLYASIPDREMAAGDGLKLVLANSPQSSEKYEISLTLEKGKVGRNKVDGWLAKPAMVKNGKNIDAAKIKTAVLPRWQDLGYRIEAEIPLALLPDLSAVTKQTFRRDVKKIKGIGNITEELPDLKAPVCIDIQVNGADQTGSLAGKKGLVKADIPKD